MTKLEGFLNLCVLWLTEAVKKVEPGSDLPPILVAVSKGGTFAMEMPEGEHVREWAIDKLEDIEASHYATFTAVWMDYTVQGVPTTREGYVASVGDRNGSMIAMFTVKRDNAGRIASLTRQHLPPTALVGGELTDLLTRYPH